MPMAAYMGSIMPRLGQGFVTLRFARHGIIEITAVRALPIILPAAAL